jgi:hypothetical protein
MLAAAYYCFLYFLTDALLRLSRSTLVSSFVYVSMSGDSATVNKWF